MPYTLPPITLTQNQTSIVSIPGSLGSVTYLKMVNASPYLLAINNLLGGSDYMQPGEANVWPVPGLTTAVQATPQQFGVSPAIIPSSVLVVTWYLEGEQPQGNYPVNFNTISFLGSSVTTNASTPNSVNQDEWTPFVLGANSLVVTKDGTTANKLDVSSGVAWLRQTDQSLGRVAENATSFTTIQINSTYYLDLNPDATYSFATSHSGQPNYLSIAQVTTDASGNIATVTDERQMNTELLGAMGTNGSALIEVQALGLLAPDLGAGITASIGHLDNTNGAFSNAFFHNTPMTGASPQGYYWASWDGSATHIPFSVGGSFGGASAWIGANGQLGALGGQASAGNLGVPVIVALAVNVAVTVTTLQTILTKTNLPAGLYRVSMAISVGGTVPATISASVDHTSPLVGEHNPVFSAVTASLTPSVSPLLNLSWSAVKDVQPAPMLLSVTAGSTITVEYQNSTATVNDVVSAIIERLA